MMHKQVHDGTSELVWGLLPHPTTGHVVRLFWRSPTGHIGGDYARSPRELSHFIGAVEGRNAYLAVNPTTSTIGVRHTAADVTHWSFFLVDIDPVKPEFNPDDALKVVLADMHARLDMELNPIIVHSGRGRQAWFRLEDVEFGESSISRKMAQRTMSWWLRDMASDLGEMHGCRIDTTSSDLPRLMRCPGTVNQATGVRSWVITPSQTIHYGLAEKLIERVPEDVFVAAPSTEVQVDTWQKAFPYITRSAQSYLTQGQEEPGRHKAAFHTASCLVEHGVPQRETLDALMWGNIQAGPDNALDHEQIIRIVEQVYDR